MKARKIISIDEYEIGKQKNYDLLDFYMSLRNSIDEPERKEYHHSLFYPILCYCIDIINKTKDLDQIKLKVGLDNDGRIYVTVGREMYDFFFLEKAGSLDDVEIEFNLGKKDFLLTSVNYFGNDNAKNAFKKLYEINPEEFEKNEFLKNKKSEFELEEKKQLNEFIQNKKEVFISKFLKGYSHQESILKAFEGKINGHFYNLPNLIFKKSNREGRTIEEIDQIYLINLKESEKLTINGFNYFYFVQYLNGKQIDKKIFPNGTKFELANNNLYFLEIKYSIKGLILDYTKLKDIKINPSPNPNASKNTKNNKMPNDKKSKSKNSFMSSFYKRDELTSLGNTFLTFNIFQDLIWEILKSKEKECNLLYIVDSDFEENMVKAFEDCLERDKIIIEDSQLSFNLYLIYTQPDLSLKHFIKESWEKKNQINILTQNITKKNVELEEKNKQIEEKNKQIESLFQELANKDIEKKIEKMQFKPISLDNSIINFVKKKIKNNNPIVLIGLYEKINDNQTYIYTSLYFFQRMNIEEKLTLVDFKTFNKVELKDLDNKNNRILFEYIINDYKDKMKYFNSFDDIYIMVDLIFLENMSEFKDEGIFGSYDITIYMIKQDKFIIHMKKESFVLSLITINNEECQNPLFQKFENSEKFQLFEIEQLASNYINLLRLKKFIEKTSHEFLKEILYLFDFKGRINYILEFCKKANNNNGNNKNCLIIITAAKESYNFLIDKFIEQYIEGENNKNYKNIIFVRRTEFGNSFSKEEIISILNYNFNIGKDFECENRIIWKNDCKNLNIDKGLFEKTGLIRLIEYESMLPIYLMSNKKINNKSIQLIEYLYFLFLPILIQKTSMPKVLIIADDYGILHNYYKGIYDNKLDITFVSQKGLNEEKFKKEIILENNNKIDVSSYEEAFKIFKDKKNLFDIIIVEKIFNENKNETSIPSIKNNYANLLTLNGIFSLNIRSCSLNEQNKRIENLKDKYKNIKIINFRLCSDFLICSNDTNIQIINDFNIRYPKLLELDNIETYLGKFIEDIDS